MAPDRDNNKATGVDCRPYSALKLDYLVLLVPQEDVRTLEPAVDLERTEPPPNGVGWIRLGNERWPVFCFSEQLRRTVDVPATRRICAVLASGPRVFGVLCSDVSLLRLPDSRVEPMPVAMVLPGRPVHALALHEGTVMCLTSAARLIAHAQAGADAQH